MNRCLIKEDSIYFISLYLEFYVQDSLCSVMSMTLQVSSFGADKKDKEKNIAKRR